MQVSESYQLSIVRAHQSNRANVALMLGGRNPNASREWEIPAQPYLTTIWTQKYETQG